MNIGLISAQNAFSFGHATINNYLAEQLEIYERERMLSDARLPVNVSTVTFNCFPLLEDDYYSYCLNFFSTIATGLWN